MESQMPVLQEPVKKKKTNIKLIVIVVLLFIALLAVLFFNSSISKISEIRISGAQFAKNEVIVKASGISVGDAFFQSSTTAIKAEVEKLLEVESAQITKKFPGVINIALKEHPAVAFELSEDGHMIALLANGTSVDATDVANLLIDKPVLTDWEKDDPIKIELAKQLALIPSKQLSDLSEILPIPSNAYPDRIRMYTRTRFEVVTAVSVLTEKIEALNAVIETQEPGKITMLLADTYVPFDSDGESDVQSN
ncbi:MULTISPECIES: cell division protein FtsQ/DivIB [unclassified Paenibacillus]|uniref:cell division protein FtsQ/DivIB n=1 Tax=unclassified Paenibacillus TaxID=185978 RepID=UPI002F40238C